MTSERSGQTIHFAQAGLMWPVIKYLEESGIDWGKYLLQSKIPHEIIADQTTPIPRSLIFRFLNAACVGEDLEDIGLLVGQRTSLQSMGEIGQMLLSSGTIRDYLENGSRLISTISSGDHYWLEDETDQLRFCASVSSLGEEDKIQDYLYLLLITINTIRHALGKPWSPTEITIPNLSDSTATKLRDVLPGVELIRDGKRASFLVPYEIAIQPIVARKELAAAKKRTLPADFITSVTQLIETFILAGQGDIDQVATATGLSSRTLQRKLRACGTSYSRLALEVRVHLAKRWLGDADKLLSDIASALGYSDPANFSRAFRGVTGLSPKAYREKLIQGDITSPSNPSGSTE
jgi:AraC-like DNA-binding protein